MKALIDKVRAGIDLNYTDVARAVGLLLSDETDDSGKTDFLTMLHRKGESAEEIVAFVRQLVDRAVDPLIEEKNLDGPMIDVCGTGGAGLDLFNVSTTIMFILAAGGVVVVKHGNRSVTSRCGSADVLEQLGIQFDMPPEDLRECVARHGLGFIFARSYHPAFRALVQMRERLARKKTRTIFNLLGPLLNPARPPRQLIGVYAPRLTSVFAEVLRQLGRERAWVVHGLAETGQGMDDISTGGPTTLTELQHGRVISGLINPRWLNIAGSTLDELAGGNAQENATILEGILSGEVKAAKCELAIVNAAAGFVVAGLAMDMATGISMAREQIDSGRALQKLRALQGFGKS